MISFESDYIAGAHPRILQRLVETNMETITGYGLDDYCVSAEKKIKEACGLGDEGEVYFLVGGTQTNQVMIDTMLRPDQGVIAASTGHISIHESGAIEFTGHKVIELEGQQGKLSAEAIEKYLNFFENDESQEFIVCPGMVYISYPTEYGTLYSKAELEAISQVCHKYGIILYIDGARLGYGLASKESDITLPEIAKLCDAFYIGGTKVGALCGEAAVFTKNNAPKRFRSQVKQHGAMLAKGRLLGIQFDTLFTDNLYFDISKHAIDMAEKLKEVLKARGYRFYLETPTNQQFIILKNDEYKELLKKVTVCFWEAVGDDKTVVRFATSWSTREEDIEELEKVVLQ